MKFTSFKNWINEQESRKTEYGCVMLYTQIPDWKKHLEIIVKDDIYDDEIGDYGLEHHPHVTVLWGIHLDETKPEDVVEVIKTFKPLTATVDTISIFDTNEDYDVVKYDVPVTPELKKYRKELMDKFPNTQTFPGYHPHMTIAYVKKGEGKNYVGKVKPFKVEFQHGVYSCKKGEKDNIKIKL